MGWLKAILQDGIAFLRGVPPAEEEVLLAAAVLGYPVETNYGRVFQVRPEPAPDNLAYTAAGLGLHTDNPYREPVPGYQILHCLIADTEGGESIFADGYAIAEKLRGADPEAFSALTTIPVDFRYRDASTELTACRTLIELDREGRIARIHWNNRSMSTARLPLHRAEGFYVRTAPSPQCCAARSSFTASACSPANWSRLITVACCTGVHRSAGNASSKAAT
jgi:gamma-butyrobetaine dioxygenase